MDRVMFEPKPPNNLFVCQGLWWSHSGDFQPGLNRGLVTKTSLPLMSSQCHFWRVEVHRCPASHYVLGGPTGLPAGIQVSHRSAELMCQFHAYDPDSHRAPNGCGREPGQSVHVKTLPKRYFICELRPTTSIPPQWPEDQSPPFVKTNNALPSILCNKHRPFL